MDFIQELQSYLKKSKKEINHLIRKLDTISTSPYPYYEERRAVFCKNWFEENGGREVFIDTNLNVICPCNITKGDSALVVTAYSDICPQDVATVFLCENNRKVSHFNVFDDAANLAALLTCARFVLNNKNQFEFGVLLVANSNKTDLNNLENLNSAAEHYGVQIKEVLTFFDGYTINL